MKGYDFEDAQQGSGGKDSKKSVDIFDINYDGLLAYYVINEHFSMKQLLTDYGVDFSGANIYCPFHDDALTGKPSAKYHDSDDAIFCFSEQKKFTAYNALKDLYRVDLKKEFYRIWADLSDNDREKFMSKYSSGSGNLSFIPSLWKRSVVVLGMFRQSKVSFRQHKNALFKVATMIYDDRIGAGYR